MSKLLILILSFTYCSLQSQSFTMETDTDTLLFGNYLEVTFSITDLDGDFAAPNFGGWDLISGPNTSSQMSIINGKMNKSSSYSYFLKPQSEGSFIIESATLDVNGNILKTDEKIIIVHPNPDNVKQIKKPRIQELSPFYRSDPENKSKKRKEFKI